MKIYNCMILFDRIKQPILKSLKEDHIDSIRRSSCLFALNRVSFCLFFFIAIWGTKYTYRFIVRLREMFSLRVCCRKLVFIFLV